MNIFLIILFFIVLVGILITIYYVLVYNNINESIIRVDEAESRIDSDLRDKYDSLDRAITLLKNKMPVDNEVFQDFVKLKIRKISNFDLDRTLVRVYNEFIAVYNETKNVQNDDELYKTIKQIDIIDDELVTLRTYYNANIVNYNRMIKKFPTNMVAKIKHYKERAFYDLKDMKDEDYKDFKL